jgi:hypothetical protein
VFLVDCVPPSPTQASVFSPLPFAEVITTDARSSRYYTVKQTRVLTTHHICALILQGWTINLVKCPYNIIYNVKKVRERKKTQERIVEGKLEFLQLHDRVVRNNESMCYLKQFVHMFGAAKAQSADKGNKVDKKLYKMVLNAGAGRLGMKDVSSYTTVNYELKNDFSRLFEKNTTEKITSFGRANFELATLINAAGLYIITRQQYLLQLKDIYPDNIPLWDRTPAVIYTDTDSVLFDRDLCLPEVYNELVFSNEIGSWENDTFKNTWSVKAKCNAVVVLGKKSYFMLQKDELGYKDVAMHSKGVPSQHVAAKFYKDNYMLMDVVKKLLLEKQLLITFPGIIRKKVQEDLSRKLFHNWEYNKKINVTTLGMDPFIPKFSFLPNIYQDDFLSFTHSPCEFQNCKHCNPWYCHIKQSLNAYNWKYDRIL